MSDIYKRMLNLLLKALEMAFSNSSMNRKSLHEIEWEMEEGHPSILGEIEIRADTVIGVARTCLKKQPKGIDELIDTLESSSVYQSEIIVNWLADNGDNFPEFMTYITAIENLRIGTITFLKKDNLLPQREVTV
jgi:hypothetical protein